MHDPDMRATEFLQRYRVLEGILERQYAGRKKSASSPIIEYLHDPDSEPIRSDLDLLREVRNILSHNSNSDGTPVIEPSSEMLDRIDTCIAHITRMRKAIEFGTEASLVCTAKPDDKLESIMQKMRRFGYSNIPIIFNSVVHGVLTPRSILNYIADNGTNSISSATTVHDLKPYTRLNSTDNDRCIFVSADTDISMIRKLFERTREKNRRLTLILITQHGDPNEPLLRLLTPWDAINDIAHQKGVEHDE